MSRTTRAGKCSWYGHDNIEKHVKHYMEDFNGTRRVKTKRDQSEIDAVNIKYKQQFDDNVKARGGIFYKEKCYWNDEIVTRQVYQQFAAKYKYITVPWSYDDAIAYYKADFVKRFRDGACSYGKRKGRFRNDCARTNRRANKKFCDQVLKNDWDHDPYPRYTDTSFKRWVWW